MEKIVSNAAGFSSAAFFSLIKNPVTFRLFLLQKLPAAFFSGLKLKYVDEDKCIVIVPYKWFTKNPFHSVYFACLSMAAEMSTGILAMGNTYKRNPKISMLVINIEGKFYKKAVDSTGFICKDGQLIKQTIETTIASGQSQIIKALSSGFNKQNELIAEFWITWSFKEKKSV